MNKRNFRRSWTAVAGIMVLALAFGLVAVGAGNAGQLPGQARVVGALGVAKVQGQDVFVDILVLVPAGEDATAAANAALARQGARPIDSAGLGSEGFTVFGLKWGAFPVIQNYNPANEPGTVAG